MECCGDAKMITPTPELLRSWLGGKPTFIAPEEIPILARYATSAQVGILEIGAAYGGSAVLFLANSNVPVTSIDPFIRDTHGNWQSSPGECRTAIEGALHHLGMNARIKDYRLITGYSTSVLAYGHMKDRFDLLYIDGAHDYESVMADVVGWGGLLEPGGVFLLHDSRRMANKPALEYARGWPGPTEVADELRTNPEYELVEEAHSLTVWRAES